MAPRPCNDGQTWDRHIAQCIARRMAEMEMDEEDDMQIALRLSQLQTDASMPLSCSDDAVTPAPASVPTQPWRLRPSVGTWLMPHTLVPQLTQVAVDPQSGIISESDLLASSVL